MNQEEGSDMRRVVYTAGSWGMFHPGHLRMIQRARSMADTLIVGVSTDQLIKKYKGRMPVDPFALRYETICCLQYPDVVLPRVKQFNVERMKKMGVTHVVMGDDWSDSQHPDLIELKKAVTVVFLPRTRGVSTSSIRRLLGL